MAAADRALDDLGARFLEALEARRKGDVDGAAELLRGVLKVEPRLPEPHMELAHILLETGQLGEAEEHAREAIRHLEAGGQWTDDLPESVILGMAWDILGEVLRRIADSDEVVFGDPARFEALMKEARAAFDRAAQIDPSNEHAGGWSRDFDLPPIARRALREVAGDAGDSDGDAGDSDGDAGDSSESDGDSA